MGEMMGSRERPSAGDVTASERDRQFASVLERATDELSSSLEYETSLERVAKALVPAFADWCVIELLEGRELRTIAISHADPERREWTRRSRTRSPDEAPVSPIAGALATGGPLLLRDVSDADLTSYSRDADHLEQLRGLQLRSIISVPIVDPGGGVDGALVLLSTDPRPRFDDDDLRLATELGRRAGTAIGHARAYRAARDAVRARDDFLAVAGHELRTPLATLVLQLESLKRALAAGSLPPKVAAARVEKTLDQTNRLNRLIDALLDVTRVTAGQLVLEPEPMDLAELVRDVGSRFDEEAVRAKVSLTVSAGTRCEGVWDPRRLDQVISNLLSNALKYGEGAPVHVACERSGEGVRVQVADRGIGVAPADTERIFDRFERATSARGRSGFGLGLWIAREIVTAHGGTISVESEHGKGSTFTIELPPRVTPPPATN